LYYVLTGTFPSLIADRITVHVKSEVQFSSDFYFDYTTSVYTLCLIKVLSD
jgi:hypothetical protein